MKEDTTVNKFYLRRNYLDDMVEYLYNGVLEMIPYDLKDNIIPMYNSMGITNNKINYYSSGDILFNEFLIDIYKK